MLVLVSFPAGADQLAEAIRRAGRHHSQTPRRGGSFSGTRQTEFARISARFF